MDSNRTWFQFRIGTLLALIAALSLLLLWVRDSSKWIEDRKRHNSTQSFNNGLKWFVLELDSEGDNSAIMPFRLWVLGAKEYRLLLYIGPPELRQEAERLYPEATFTTSINE